MVSLDEALNIVISKAQKSECERIELLNSLGFITAEDIFSDIFMPPFNKSAVDGFACRRDDLKTAMEIIETIPAGKLPEKTVVSGTCSRIMTGAKVPEGADCVIMVEYTQVNDNKVVFTGDVTNDNYARMGEDLQEGALVIPKNTCIDAQHIAVMASIGSTHPLVCKKPSVAVFSTGNELVEPGIKPTGGQIRNSNSYQLMAQCQQMNIPATYAGIIPDDREKTRQMISNALKQHQIILLTGGVSMGDFDFVPEIMKELGFNIHFDSISVQPGKPTTYATKDDKFLFGLPGNPVSSFMHFSILVKPLIYKIMGFDYQPATYKIPMAEAYQRKKAERTGLVPVYINKNYEVSVVEFHGSAHINAMLNATGFISLDKGQHTLNKGEHATYRPF